MIVATIMPRTQYAAGEVLDGANKYKCSKEKKPVRAIKRMTVHAAPNVLVLQLKRFEFSMSGHKISKKVKGQTASAHAESRAAHGNFLFSIFVVRGVAYASLAPF